MADTAEVIQLKKSFYQIYLIPKAYRVTWDQVPVIVDPTFVQTHTSGGFAVTVTTKGQNAYIPNDVTIYLAFTNVLSYLAHEFAHASYFSLSGEKQLAFVEEFNRLADEGLITGNYSGGITYGMEPYAYFYTANYNSMPETLKQFYPYIYVPGPTEPPPYVPPPTTAVVKIFIHNTSKFGLDNYATKLRVKMWFDNGVINGLFMDGQIQFSEDQTQEFDFTITGYSVTVEILDPNDVSLDKETLNLGAST